MQYYDEKWTLNHKLIFARNINWLGDISGSQSICKDVIETYPDSSLSFFALDILWQSSRCAKQGSEYDLKSFEKYVRDLSVKKDKKTLYGYSELIYSGFDNSKSLTSSCDKIYNEYQGTFLPIISLYKKFLYYYNDLNDISKAKEIADQLQQEYPKSLEAESAMSHFNSKQSLSKESKILSSGNQSALPDKYAVSSNYPNPFNPSTSINFALPKDSKVSISIYNTLGQLVKKMNYQNLSAGVHPFTWDGKNESGNLMSSGLYILHFNAQSVEGDNEIFSKSIKLLLVR